MPRYPQLLRQADAYSPISTCSSLVGRDIIISCLHASIIFFCINLIFFVYIWTHYWHSTVNNIGRATPFPPPSMSWHISTILISS